MRLRTVKIRAFRGFGTEVSFALGNTNVFAGPNGFGKTSFFDAIQWCLFGHVPRFSGTRDFSRAGDVFQNKFHNEPYFVSIDFESDNGDQLQRRRTSHSCASKLNGKAIADEDFLRRLGLGTAGEDTFLRYFLLQQEKIDEFVKDLNPRGRYDSMVSLLQFSTPEFLSERLENLRKELDSQSEVVLLTVSSSSSRVSTLERDIQTLNEATGNLSVEVIDREYRTLLDDCQPLKWLTGFGDSTSGQLAASLPRLADRLNLALRELNQLIVTVMDLKKLKGHVPPVTDSLKSRVSELSDIIAETERLLKELDAKEIACRRELETLARDLQISKRSEDRLKSLLAEIKDVISSDMCPVCRRPISKTSLVSIIDTEIGQQSEQLAQLIATRGVSENRLLTLQGDKKELARKLESSTSERLRLQGALNSQEQFESGWKTVCASPVLHEFELDGLDFESFANELTRLALEVDGFHRRALDLLQLAERLSNATTLLPKKEVDLKQAQTSFNHASEQQKILDRVRQMLHACASAVSETRTNIVTKTLEGNKPLMRNIYRRLQPHPLFTDIDFEVVRAYKEAELYFRVQSRDHKITAYPSTLFSASQLNAVAVCIFIALSLRSARPLKMIMLDDPIQSMDDINVLGLSDVLRQVKSRRQLFISTHNRDFYRLLLNKLRPVHADDTVKGFRFEGWSNDGPTIQAENIDFIDMKINLGEMASSFRSSPLA